MILFRYGLGRAGSADAYLTERNNYLSDDSAEVRIPASYITDALRVLADSVERLFTENSSKCTWLDEPGQFRWKFVRNNQALHVEVVGVHQRVHPQGRWLLPSENVLFSGDTAFIHFVSQVAGALRRILDKWGLEGYQKEWRGPFPEDEYRRLSHALTAHNSGRLFCPRCGDRLEFIDTEWTCVRGRMGLSERIAEQLFGVYVQRTREPSSDPLKFTVGGTWYCPGCACRLSERDGVVMCDDCGRSLNEFVYQLVEFHPHRKVSSRSGLA